MKHSHSLRHAGIALLSMGPSFAFPFILSSFLGKEEADSFFLATAVSLILVNILGNTIEVHTVVQVGRIIARDHSVIRRDLSVYRRRVFLFTFASVICIGALLIWLYAYLTVGSEHSDFLVLAPVLLFVPLFGGLASTYTGEVIAAGKQSAAVSIQSLRNFFPMVAVLAIPSISLLSLAITMILGESLRLLLSVIFARSIALRTDAGNKRNLNTNGLITQSISTSTSQAGPVTDRSFLATAPTGSLTAYELADKLFFAAVQFLSLSLLLSRLRHWAGLRSLTIVQARALIYKDLILLTAISAGLGIVGILGLRFIGSFGVLPDAWNTGLVWAQILLLALPFAMVNMAGARLLVVADEQRTLMVIACSSTVFTIILDALLFVVLGAIGIPIATTIVRVALAAAYLVILTRVIGRVAGTDRIGGL